MPLSKLKSMLKARQAAQQQEPACEPAAMEEVVFEVTAEIKPLRRGQSPASCSERSADSDSDETDAAPFAARSNDGAPSSSQTIPARRDQHVAQSTHSLPAHRASSARAMRAHSKAAERSASLRNEAHPAFLAGSLDPAADQWPSLAASASYKSSLELDALLQRGSLQGEPFGRASLSSRLPVAVALPAADDGDDDGDDLVSPLPPGLAGDLQQGQVCCDWEDGVVSSWLKGLDEGAAWEELLNDAAAADSSPPAQSQPRRSGLAASDRAASAMSTGSSVHVAFSSSLYAT